MNISIKAKRPSWRLGRAAIVTVGGLTDTHSIPQSAVSVNYPQLACVATNLDNLTQQARARCLARGGAHCDVYHALARWQLCRRWRLDPTLEARRYD